MNTTELAWQAEAACHNAWPALHQVWCGDWMLRISGGFGRRVNSANPLHVGAGAVDETLAACHTVYGGQGQPVIFRVPTLLDPAVDARLEELGFTSEGETITLHADIGDVDATPDEAVEILSYPGDDWLTAMKTLQERDDDAQEFFTRIVRSLMVPVGFAGVRIDDEFVALAFGAMHGDLFGIESVITSEAHRGNGYARRLLNALFAWAAAAGARGVCLQVEAPNAPAIALYKGLGLTTELYRYHYRREPV
jgi:N-acetylglutamate synthase